MGQRTPIAMIRKEDETTSVALVVAEICKVVEFVHAFQIMNQSQIATTAQLIMKKFYYLSILEINHAFETGMMGEYGEVKKMDGTVLLGWLDRFDEQRTKVSGDIQNEETLKNIYEAGKVFSLANEKTGETLGEVFAKSNAAARKQDRLKVIECDKEVARPDLPPFEKTVQEEWAAMAFGDIGTEHVNLKCYKEEWMDFSTYREERMLEELEPLIEKPADE